MIPLVDQVCDVRDLVANCRDTPIHLTTTRSHIVWKRPAVGPDRPSCLHVERDDVAWRIGDVHDTVEDEGRGFEVMASLHLIHPDGAQLLDVGPIDLIERLAPLVYMPIDISASALHGATAALVRQFPSLNIASICGDFTRPLHLPDLSDFAVRRKIAYFPGSTIGNFTQDEASAFLRLIGLMVGKGGGLLIGVDTKKAKPILDAAYDDRQGVTAAFNLNLLTRINRELGADFHLDQFSHKAFYDEAKGRIEMHLESRCEQVVHVDGNTFALRAGETIHTENSCKYTVDEFRSMGREAGFKPVKVWIDQDRMFSVHAMTVV